MTQERIAGSMVIFVEDIIIFHYIVLYRRYGLNMGYVEVTHILDTY